MKTKTICAVVDRVEGDLAVILLGKPGYAVTWPIEDLPDGISEGSVLVVSVREDSEASKAAKAEIGELIDRLKCEDCCDFTQ